MKNLKAKFFLFLSFSSLLFLSNCNKDSDQESPIVEILLPENGLNIQIPDTILVRIKASDNQNLQRVSVALVDKNQIELASGESLNINQQNYEGTLELILNDAYLPSGDFQIRATAEDSRNLKNAFIDVFVSEDPTILEGYLVLSQGSNLELEKFDLNGNRSTIYSLNSDFSGASFSNRYFEFYVLGKMNTKLHAISIPQKNSRIVYETQNNLNQEYFQNLDFSKEINYLSSLDGKTRGFDRMGNLVFNYDKNSTTLYCSKAKKLNHWFLMKMEPKLGGNTFWLDMVHSGSGNFEQTRMLPGELMDMVEIQNQHYLLMINENNKGEIYDYRRRSNALAKVPQSIISGAVNAAIQIGNETVIAHQGGVSIFNFFENQGRFYLTGFQVQALEYDEKSGQILIVSHNQVLVYNFAPKQSIRVLNIGNKVLKAHFLNNK